MKRLVWAIIGVPVAIILIVLSVANREPVQLRLDPFSAADPAVAYTLPFFLHLFAALILGMAIGGVAVWFGQGRHRREARRERSKAKKFEEQAEANRQRAEELAAQKIASEPGSQPRSGAFPLVRKAG